MTNLEVVTELRSLVKPYIGIMEQNKFSAYCIRIEKGRCKPITTQQFFILFGYYGDWNNYEKR